MRTRNVALALRAQLAVRLGCPLKDRSRYKDSCFQCSFNKDMTEKSAASMSTGFMWCCERRLLKMMKGKGGEQA